MDLLESLKQQIARTETVLVESQENYNNNPDSYSAKLLLVSVENHLADLLKQYGGELERRKTDTT